MNRKRPRTGFSLVEVVLAMGIMSFGLTTMLALMPVGLGAMRESREDVQMGQIVQEMTSRAMLTPFTQLTEGFIDGGPYCFDDQGVPQEEKAANTRFMVTPKNKGWEASSSIYPGSDRADNLENNFFVLELEIQVLTGAQRTTSYIVHVPNQGN